ncbi:MAG: LamG-like jellyroll fold domain-containing protein [Lewinella sp.]
MKSIFTLFTVLLLGGMSAQDLDSGLVIHYPLDGNLTDSISSETAENNGNLTFEEGLLGSAVRFFNQDAYFVTPAEKLQVGLEADGGTAGTFAMFVNHREAPLATDRQNYIAQKNGCGPDDNNRGRVVLYRQDPTNESDPDSLISFVTGRPLRTQYKLDMADTWIHLALTIDPETREWAFFVDGVQTARDTFTGTTQAENSCGEFVIGHHLTFDNETQTFDGLMDDLRFYNRVLTQEEITLLANQGTTSTREEIATNAFSLAPNPASTDQAVTIRMDHSVFQRGSALRLHVVDATGRRVLEQRYDSVVDRLTLNHQLVSGVYTLMLTDGERLATQQLMIR